MEKEFNPNVKHDFHPSIYQGYNSFTVNAHQFSFLLSFDFKFEILF